MLTSGGRSVPCASLPAPRQGVGRPCKVPVLVSLSRGLAQWAGATGSFLRFMTIDTDRICHCAEQQE
jgi:hypothetical protein